jgi:ribonuclease D
MIISQEDFYINSQEELNRMVCLIKEVGVVALDTEFTRQTTYYPILSIIQVAVKASAKKKESFIIDCIADIDLTGLFAVIADPKIIKILHSCAQDLQIFHHKSGLLPQSIVDTQLMANFCGYGFNIGYSALVDRICDWQLDKEQQRSDWQSRPLSAKQIEYALLDVFFLEEIYEEFCTILKSKNRFEWLLEEMENFINKSLFKSDESLSRDYSFRGKNEKQIAQIKSLISWRERWAIKLDVPRQHFIKDEAIERIVTVQKFPSNFTSEMKVEAQKILDENEEVIDKPKKEEKNFAMSESQKLCYSKAKIFIAEIAAHEKFQEQFLITASDLKKAVCEKKLFDKIASGWRYQVFAKELEQLIINF